MKILLTEHLEKVFVDLHGKDQDSRIIRSFVSLLRYYTGTFPVGSIDEHSLYLTKRPYTKSFRKLVLVTEQLKKLHIVKEVKRHAKHYFDEPDNISCTAYSPKDKNNTGHGFSFFDEEAVLWAAVAECLERYLWRRVPFYRNDKVLCQASWKELAGPKVDIFRLAGFSEEQKETTSELNFSEDTEFMWCHVKEIGTERNIFCPVQLISNQYARRHMKPVGTKTDLVREPMLRWCVTTGLATGQSVAEAQVVGMLEIVERDAFMITHLQKLTPQQVDLTNYAQYSKELQTILEEFTWYGLDVQVMMLPTDFNVFVMCAAVFDTTTKGPAVTFGASADLDSTKAILSAIAESYAVRLSVKNHLNDTYNPDCLDQETRLIHWANHKRLPKLNHWFTGRKVQLRPTRKVSKERKKERYSKSDRKYLIQEFKKLKQPLYYTELAPQIGRQTGLHVVNVLAPEMQPMHLNEIIPYRGGERLYTVPKKLGLAIPDGLNLEPHPFP